MSKAFTKDDDGTAAPPAPPRRRGVPVPEPNFVTAAGARAARAELERLVRDGGDPDRARELTEHLATAQVVDPPAGAERAQVGLGAAVTLETEAGARLTYRIVGAIEADPKRGRLSWQAPIANALWGARVGDAIELPRAGGTEDAEIVAIEYDE